MPRPRPSRSSSRAEECRLRHGNAYCSTPPPPIRHAACACTQRRRRESQIRRPPRRYVPPHANIRWWQRWRPRPRAARQSRLMVPKSSFRCLTPSLAAHRPRQHAAARSSSRECPCVDSGRETRGECLPPSAAMARPPVFTPENARQQKRAGTAFARAPIDVTVPTSMAADTKTGGEVTSSRQRRDSSPHRGDLLLVRQEQNGRGIPPRCIQMLRSSPGKKKSLA